MLRRISEPTAGATLLVIQVLSLTYHALIVTSVVSYENVWGGRLTNEVEMYRFEAVSIVLNLLMIALVMRRMRTPVPSRLLRGACWCFAALFALNTLGNLAAKTMFETMVFTPLTLVAALCFARLGLSSGEQ